MKVKRRPTPAPHIPFISLADIAWQIIIFFFLASSFTKRDALKADAPSATEKPAQQQQDDKTVTVVATNDSFEIEKKPYSVQELLPELTRRMAALKKADRKVIIDAQKGLSFQRFTSVTYAIEKAGAIPMVPDDDE